MLGANSLFQSPNEEHLSSKEGSQELVRGDSGGKGRVGVARSSRTEGEGLFVKVGEGNVKVGEAMEARVPMPTEREVVIVKVRKS